MPRRSPPQSTAAPQPSVWGGGGGRSSPAAPDLTLLSPSAATRFRMAGSATRSVRTSYGRSRHGSRAMLRRHMISVSTFRFGGSRSKIVIFRSPRDLRNGAAICSAPTPWAPGTARHLRGSRSVQARQRRCDRSSRGRIAGPPMKGRLTICSACGLGGGGRLFTGDYMVFGPRPPHCGNWCKFSQNGVNFLRIYEQEYAQF